MAHKLTERKDGTVELRYNTLNGVPWHGLGKASNGLMTPADAFDGTLDWEAAKVGLVTEPFQTANGLTIPSAAYGDKFAIARMDTGEIIGECGKTFQIFQNSQLRAFIEALAGEKAVVETIGSIYGGERVWVLLALKEISVHGKDVIKNYLLVSNSFRAGTAILIALVSMRVVCSNTHAAALAEIESDKRRKKSEPLSFKIVHSLQAGERLEVAAETLGIATKQLRATNTLFEQLAKKRVNDTLVAEFFAKVYAPGDGKSEAAKARAKQAEARATLAEELFRTGKGADIFPGTAYNLFQAVTDVEDHAQGRRRPDGQMDYAMFGGGATIKSRALAFAELLLK